LKHILFTLKGCAADDLDDEGFIRDVLYQASIWCKSTLLSLKSHKFEPQGVTAVALLAESHISIHTWPENGTAVCDIFTCGDHTIPEDGVEYMRAELNAAEIVTKTILRDLE
jgi:S-adenosylmethionine decarboxylase